MTLTIEKGFNDFIKIEFIKQAIPLYNIKKITIEDSTIENEINIITVDTPNCLSLIEKIKEFSDDKVIEENLTNQTVIVLWA